jgi:hypothetical protein
MFSEMPSRTKARHFPFIFLFEHCTSQPVFILFFGPVGAAYPFQPES